MTPWPSSTAVKVDTLPYSVGSALGLWSVATGGITSSMLMPSGAEPSALRASAPLPWRLETTP